MGIIAAGIATAVVGGVASGIASRDQSKAQEKAQKSANATELEIAGMQAALQAQANKLTSLKELVARGAPITKEMADALGLSKDMIGKSSAVLPMHLAKYETQLGQQAAEVARTLQEYYRDPAADVAANEKLVKSWGASVDQADQMAKDILSGKTTEQMLSDAQPVFDARMQLAQTRKNTQLEKLSEQLNRIDAIQSRKGYTGDSFGNRMVKFNAERGIAADAASELGSANLQNALEKAAIQQQGRELQLNNMDLPDSRTSSAIGRRTLAQDAAADRANNGMASSLGSLSFFNIGPHGVIPAQAAQINPRMQTVTPAITGKSALASGLAGLANSLSGALLNGGMGQQQQQGSFMPASQWGGFSAGMGPVSSGYASAMSTPGTIGGFSSGALGGTSMDFTGGTLSSFGY